MGLDWTLGDSTPVVLAPVWRALSVAVGLFDDLGSFCWNLGLGAIAREGTLGHYALVVSYRGTQYAGWQRQENALAIQQVLEEALAELTGEFVRTMGSGRTDRGVHARGQVVSLSLGHPWSPRSLVSGTNRFLPEDIRVLGARQAEVNFDARRNAASKRYRYRIRCAHVLSPLESWNTYRFSRDVKTLDLDSLFSATSKLVGSHDFSAFAKRGGSHGDPRRRILEADWRCEEDLLVFEIQGQGFLRGMVRALVGTLLEVAKDRRTVEEFAKLLLGGRRQEAGPNVPAHGLELTHVEYPDSCFLRCDSFAPTHFID